MPYSTTKNAEADCTVSRGRRRTVDGNFLGRAESQSFGHGIQDDRDGGDLRVRSERIEQEPLTVGRDGVRRPEGSERVRQRRSEKLLRRRSLPAITDADRVKHTVECEV